MVSHPVIRLATVLAVTTLALTSARAEPYLAVRSGLNCSSCHMNRTGGGGRTTYGAGYGAQQLPWKKLWGSRALFDGNLHERIRVGADFRGVYSGRLQHASSFVGGFEVETGNLYLGIDLIPDRLLLYVDERVAPGGAGNREAFALLRAGPGGMYVKAGRFFQPFGLRLQDDDAATRRFTGFNFDGSDSGVELGAESGSLSTAIAVTNGTSGGPETDNGKQVSWIGTYVRPRWRAGLTASNNDRPGARRSSLGGVFGGVRAGPLVILGELDAIRNDDGVLPAVYGSASHVEVDWTAHDGWTARAWAGSFEADRDVGGQRRSQWGIGVDWTPLPGLQVRAYYRDRNGPDSLPGARDDFAVVEVHVFF